MASTGTSSVRRTRHNQSAEKVLRLLICAASSPYRAELERRLHGQSGVYIVGAIAHISELPLAISENDPDVLVLQLRTPSHEIHWEELIALGIPIVLLVESADLLSAASAIAGGVQAVIAGEASGEELATAAATATAGLFTVSRDLADLIRHGLAAISQQDANDFPLDQASSTDEFLEPLTLREREVLEMMSEGLSNKQIAARLDISANTVKFHISSIFGKLGASSRTEATTLGLRRGLITI